MTTEELIRNLVLNENAYFFKKIRAGRLSKNLIEGTFREASFEKTGRYLLNQVKVSHRLANKDIEYSICVFKYAKKPSFIRDEIVEWNETKLAYLVIVDFDNYVAVG
ncbi:hypothetical protein EYV94_28255 [Puteibacter caeruleilacunae]|nr:hypothetical protein EYV94_28255 [Puteibacter caeruleilacunae]